MAQAIWRYNVDAQCKTAIVEIVWKENQELVDRRSFNLAQLESLIGDLRAIQARPGNQPYIDHPQLNVSFDRAGLETHIAELCGLRDQLRRVPPSKVSFRYNVDAQYKTAIVEIVWAESQKLYDRRSFNLAQLESLLGDFREILACPGKLPYIDPQTNIKFDLAGLKAHISGLVGLRADLRIGPGLQNWNRPPNPQLLTEHREAGTVDRSGIPVYDETGEPSNGGAGGHGAV